MKNIHDIASTVFGSRHDDKVNPQHSLDEVLQSMSEGWSVTYGGPLLYPKAQVEHTLQVAVHRTPDLATELTTGGFQHAADRWPSSKFRVVFRYITIALYEPNGWPIGILRGSPVIPVIKTLIGV